MAGGSELLREQWAASSARLGRIVAGLTDEEYFWEPCDGCWSVRPRPGSEGGWVMDYPDVHPDPPPVTTIGWRLLHIAHGNQIYWEHSFGPATRTFLDLDIPGTAQAAADELVASQEPVAEALAGTDDAALGAPVPTHFGETWPAGRVFRTLLDEQVHHGAEISLLRDLYRNRATLGRPR